MSSALTNDVRSDSTELPPNPILRQIIAKGIVEAPDGTHLTVHSAISQANLIALYKMVLSRRPRLVVEIGMAYGVSTLGILTALHHLNYGELISIDPYPNWDTGMAVARHQVERAGFASRHRHIRECSYAALPSLLAQGVKADLVYVDGMHSFEGAFVDFFYGDKLIDVGGVIGFNDAGWRSVFKVIRYLQTHRCYRELDAGLPRVYRSRNIAFALVKRIQGRSHYDRYFEKTDAWEPPYNYYRAF